MSSSASELPPGVPPDIIWTPEPPLTETVIRNTTASILHNEHICPKWLVDQNWSASTTLEKINTVFMARNVAGIVFVSILMTLGILGNIIVFIAYYFKFKSSNYRVYVLFLAMLDLVNCCLSMPFVILYLAYPVDFPSNFICKAGHFFGYFCGVSSPLALVLIALDRFQKVCRPLKRQLDERQAKICCGLILFMTLCFTWFTPILYGNVSMETGINGIKGTRCFREVDSLLLTFSESYYIVLITLFTIVTILLSILYYFIMRKVHTHSKYFSDKRKNSLGGCTKSIQTRKTTVTFLIITAVYVLSTITHDGLALLLHFKEDLECMFGFHTGAVFYTFLWTVFINNVSNPIIYGLSDDRFFALVKGWLNKGQNGGNLVNTVPTPSSSRNGSKNSISFFCKKQLNNNPKGPLAKKESTDKEDKLVKCKFKVEFKTTNRQNSCDSNKTMVP